MPSVEGPEGPQKPRCRHCGEQVEKAEANSPWEWVHTDGWYRCSALQNTLATPGRRYWADRTGEDAREGGTSELGLISLLLRQAAREHLRLKDGDHWPSGVADAQAAVLFAAGMRLPVDSSEGPPGNNGGPS